MPEHGASQEITKIIDKLVKEINAAVNQSVKAINSVGIGSGKAEKSD
jgi:hypothetical protein